MLSKKELCVEKIYCKGTFVMLLEIAKATSPLLRNCVFLKPNCFRPAPVISTHTPP